MSKALIVIDVQKAFEHPSWGKRNNQNAEEHIKRLIDYWRKWNETIIHIQHISTNPKSLFFFEHDTAHFKEIVQPLGDEIVIQKQVNSAFIGTDLEKILHEKQIRDVVIVGLTTPHCVSTTIRMSANLGFKTTVIADATAAFELTDHKGITYDAETIHSISLATLHGEFADVKSIDEWLKEMS
ncbi:cysteine hydrolase family protein [Alkalicoccobacillus murimartini]|uniref:Nicotinamidase-related amidase n=1 Tax=Alkalicoccobacillus murimartini TaxID=171685 RepID=A0ABT9YMM0_9BACI|nr:cysteine hydrolase family protein [Alkalicoccobacillus murimartini]MDQ0208741.1 nicotinamidase-related amidase [Alkalicoccobacillus murimartini]